LSSRAKTNKVEYKGKVIKKPNEPFLRKANTQKDLISCHSISKLKLGGDTRSAAT
jgi:hypothetical protein